MTGKALAITVRGLLAGVLALGSAAAADAPMRGNREIGAIYPAKSSIRRDGARASMIVLFSYKRMQSGYVTDKGQTKAFYYNATRTKLEFDCRNHRSRVRHTVFFSDRLGRDNVVHQQDAPGSWTHDDDYARKDSLSFTACQSSLEP